LGNWISHNSEGGRIGKEGKAKKAGLRGKMLKPMANYERGEKFAGEGRSCRGLLLGGETNTSSKIHTGAKGSFTTLESKKGRIPKKFKIGKSKKRRCSDLRAKGKGEDQGKVTQTAERDREDLKEGTPVKKRCGCS